MVILEFDSVSKQLSKQNIITDISFKVDKGDILGIIGPNGAGKTTLLSLAIGLIKPDSGSISLFSTPLEPNLQKLRQKINFASSNLRLNGYASVDENLMTFARLYQIKQAKEKIEELVHYFEISYLVKSKIKVYQLSAGENAKVNLIKALINGPEILFLDEICAFFDRETKNRLIKLLKKNHHQVKQTIIYVSHHGDEIRSLCNKLMFINQGKIKYFGKVTTKYDD